MTSDQDKAPARVPLSAKPAGEIRERWKWVEPGAWTERMLTALEEGVKGGRWFSLMDKVYSERVLRASFARVKRNGGAPGVDHVTIEMFEKRLDSELARLGEQLRNGTYRPQGIRRTWIPKPGSRERRPLGIPTVRDRVVQTALRMVLEPIFEWDFGEHSYGFRPGRSGHDAVRRVDALLRQGHVWVVDADLRQYFDTVNHEILLRQIRRQVADGRVLELLEAFLSQRVVGELESWVPEEGTPQGAVISPLLSNIYLDPLDHRMADDGFQMVRYADDFVILCRTEDQAREALARVQSWTARVGLRLHPDKTHIVDATQRGGFDFLGYHFERGYKWPRAKSLARLKDAVRAKTKRTSGHSLAVIISEVNRTLRGWYGYFRLSHPTTFARPDAWVRMRLRSILRKRHGRKGKGRGRDHQRWPNSFFAERGLFSFVTAYEHASQSSRR